MAPFAVNNTGDIVGETIVSGMIGPIRGFLLKGSVFSLIDFPGATITRAFGINDRGQIVGTFDETHGYLLTDGAFSVIDFPGALETHPWKINDASSSAKIVFAIRTASSDAAVRSPTSDTSRRTLNVVTV